MWVARGTMEKKGPEARWRKVQSCGGRATVGARAKGGSQNPLGFDGGENRRRIERLREKKKDGETEGEGWTERLRDPGAVVEPPLGVHVDAAKARRGQQPLDAVGEVGRAGGGVLDLVHGSGEAIEVVDGVVAAGNGADGGDSGVLVAGDDEDGGGFLRIHRVFPRLEEFSGRKRLVDAQRRRSVGSSVWCVRVWCVRSACVAEKRWGAEEETRRLWEKDRESPARIPLRF
ncbi:hypothetical protein PS2_018378 [Malus domestica]